VCVYIDCDHFSVLSAVASVASICKLCALQKCERMSVFCDG